jgi:hypothetical protein
MIAVDVEIAQSTKKPPAAAAGNDGFFALVKKTAGLLIGRQQLAAATAFDRPVHGRIDRRPEIRIADRTPHLTPGIKELPGQLGVAFGAIEHQPSTL